MNGGIDQLRKKAFGGFNPKDVVDFIEKSKNELFEYKKDSKKTIEELKEKIEALQKENADLRQELAEKADAEVCPVAEEEKTTVSEINEATSQLRRVADDLCDSLREFMDRISQNSVAVTLKSKEEKLAENLKLLEEVEAEIYATLGIESSAEEKEEKAEEQEIASLQEPEGDKVSLILSQGKGFFAESFSEEKSEKAKEQEKKAEGKTASDILGAFAFLK